MAGRVCPQPPPPTLTLAAGSRCGEDSAGGLASSGGQAPLQPGRGFRDGQGPKPRLSSLPNTWSREDILETDWILGGRQGGQDRGEGGLEAWTPLGMTTRERLGSVLSLRAGATGDLSTLLPRLAFDEERRDNCLSHGTQDKTKHQPHVGRERKARGSNVCLGPGGRKLPSLRAKEKGK